jgi:hypothetical protein
MRRRDTGGGGRMTATLYGIPASHPVYAVELMLDRAGARRARARAATGPCRPAGGGDRDLVLPRFMVAPLAPAVIRILARHHKARDEAVRQDLAALPALLDRIDGWIEEGVLGGAEPNVADYQVATSLALLMSHDDLRPMIEARPAGRLARRLAPDYPGRMPPAFPPDWLS